jgi:hypothetical protein
VHTEKVGFLTALVIVWLSTFVVGTMLALFLLPGNVGILLGAIRGDNGRVWASAAVLVAAMAFVGGACVCFGVRLMNFEISYALAAFAMGIGELLKTALTFATISNISSDPTGIAGPGLGVLLLPLGIVVGLLLPAYLVDAGTGREPKGIPPGRVYQGMPSDRI